MKFSTFDSYEIAESFYDEGYGHAEDLIMAKHTRTVIFLKNGIGKVTKPFFIIKDRFSSLDGKKHKYEILYNLQPKPYKETEDFVTSYLSDGVSLTVSATGEKRVAVAEKHTDPYLHKPYFLGIRPSSDKTAMQASPTVVVKKCGKKCEIVSLLYSSDSFDYNLIFLKKSGRKYILCSPSEEIEKINLNDYIF